MSEPKSSRQGPEQERAVGDLAAAGSKETDGRRRVPAFLVGLLAGLVALGLIWAGTATLARTGSDSRAGADRGEVTRKAGTSAAATGADSSSQDQDSRRVTRMERCQQADATLTEPLQAAVPALDRWQIHVGAMNKLVEGAITYEQASAFWTHTRVGARRSLDHFYSVMQRAPLAELDCPAPSALASGPAELGACADRVSRQRQALEAARTAMGTWRAHVEDMAMRRMGHLSPTVANQKWLANWRRGVRELRSYDTARQGVDSAAAC